MPIRFGRTLTNPSTFLGGTSGLMAHDLAKTPATGVRVQLCGAVLARALAKSDDATTISGYLGKSDSFDEAVARFVLDP